MSSQGPAGSGIKTTGFNIAKKANVSQGYNVNNISGVYVAEVMKDADNQHNGRITVKIPELGSTSERIILLTTPFGGNTSISDGADDPTMSLDTNSLFSEYFICSTKSPSKAYFFKVE